ncbi:MAG: transglutaminase family protein, partial [Lysobacterales bacterium]
HVTLAWGRDYADVAPLKGVMIGGGSHALEVSVDVMPLLPPAEADDEAA